MTLKQGPGIIYLGWLGFLSPQGLCVLAHSWQSAHSLIWISWRGACNPPHKTFIKLKTKVERAGVKTPLVTPTQFCEPVLWESLTAGWVPLVNLH